MTRNCLNVLRKVASIDKKAWNPFRWLGSKLGLDYDTTPYIERAIPNQYPTATERKAYLHNYIQRLQNDQTPPLQRGPLAEALTPYSISDSFRNEINQKRINNALEEYGIADYDQIRRSSHRAEKADLRTKSDKLLARAKKTDDRVLADEGYWFRRAYNDLKDADRAAGEKAIARETLKGRMPQNIIDASKLERLKTHIGNYSPVTLWPSAK